MAAQLPIQFEFNIQQTFTNYYPGPNQEVVAHLTNNIINPNEQLIFLWGSPGTGKTHLLNASCQLAHEHFQNCFIYSFTTEILPSTKLLEDLEHLELVCFDNIDRIAGNREWEQAFFYFFNRHRDKDHQLLLSSSTPPQYLTIALMDLKTRLNWGLTLNLIELTDLDSLAALNFKADSMGVKISPEVGRFLITHYARDLPSLWALLAAADQASLAAKRRLTIPFLKQLIKSQPTPIDKE